jgi:hypothetical protein
MLAHHLQAGISDRRAASQAQLAWMDYSMHCRLDYHVSASISKWLHYGFPRIHLPASAASDEWSKLHNGAPQGTSEGRQQDVHICCGPTIHSGLLHCQQGPLLG